MCAEKLAVKQIEKKSGSSLHQGVKKEHWQKHPEILQYKKNQDRIAQSKLKFIDEKNSKVPGNFVVYKDLMVFKELGKCNYFGGRCLLTINNEKNVKKQI